MPVAIALTAQEEDINHLPSFFYAPETEGEFLQTQFEGAAIMAGKSLWKEAFGHIASSVGSGKR